MIKIIMRDKNLIIDGSDAPSIFDWSHRSFFTIASGFDINPKTKEYILLDKQNLHKILSETVKYLKEEGFSFEVDAYVKELLEKIDFASQEYQDAVFSEKKLRTTKKSIVIEPVGLIRNLKDYQRKGFQHLITVKNGANFSVPGSGKTTIIYSAFEKLRQDKAVEKLLVIGPRSCFQPWEDESRYCIAEKIRIARVTGTKNSRKSLYLNSEDCEVFLCTYHTATIDKEEIINLCNKHKTFIVVDESHNIKSIETGTRADALIEISHYATRRAILSGTPIPNSLIDIWSQITFLWPDKQILGDRSTFKFKCEDPNNVPEIKRLVKPFIFRTTKKELKLPKQKFTYHFCDLKPYQKSIYKALSTKILNEINLEPNERIVLRQWRKAKIVRLIQSASNPTLLSKYSTEFNVPPLTGDGLSVVELIEKYNNYETPAKFETAINLVKGLVEENKKVVLWTSFIFNIQMLQTFLKEYEPLVVYGDIPKDDKEDVEFNREQQIRKFKDSNNAMLLIANPAACAESISLHKICHDAIYLDRTFNCGQYLQSLDRIHRIGLESNEIVNYHLIVGANTIDETIDKRLKEKEENMLNILEDDLPIGSFEVDHQELGRSEDEEKVDFDQTIKDLKNNINLL